jgi:signal transduction histidine kinase
MSRQALYSPISIRAVIRNREDKPSALLFAVWLAVIVTCVLLGLSAAHFEWTGIRSSWFGLELHVSVYPALILCVPVTLWFGFWWGAVPAYLATLASALGTGMPAAWAVLFSFSDVLSLFTLAHAYRVVPLGTDLRSVQSIWFFVQVSFVSGVIGSAGSFIWTATNALGIRDGLAVWEGWWLGYILQSLVVAVPLIFLLSPSIQRWKASLPPPRVRGTPSAREIGVIFVFLALSLSAYIIIADHFSYLRLQEIVDGIPDPDLSRAHRSALEPLKLVRWVSIGLVFFATGCAFQVAGQWTKASRRTAANLATSEAKIAGLYSDLQSRTRQLATAYDALEQRNSEVELANRLKNEFLEQMSHELRTPLNAIIGFSDILGSGKFGSLNPRQQSFATEIAKSGRHLLRLINDILGASEIQSGNVRLNIEVFQTSEAISEVLASVKPLSESKGLNIEFRSETDTLVRADRRRFQEILVHLLDNAIKFTSFGGAVWIETWLDSGYLHLAINDDGLGIHPDEREAIFDMFRQVGPTTKGTREGIGLGLAIVKSLVALQGGRVWVENLSGSGSRFVFTIPAAGSPAGPHAAS